VDMVHSLPIVNQHTNVLLSIISTFEHGVAFSL